MTWEELVALLISTGEMVHVIRGDGADAVSLQLPPAGWFVSMRTSGELSVGVYEGEENRLVGTRVLPLGEIDPDMLRAEVAEVRAKQIAAFITRDFWPPADESPPRPRRW